MTSTMSFPRVSDLKETFMKTMIYQYWSGVRPEYSYASEVLFRDYAKAVGADYFFADDVYPIRAMHKRYFGALRPILDPSFHEYDAVLFVDMDVIPKAAPVENIFDELLGHIMLAEEPKQPVLREDMKGNINGRNDQRWARISEALWRTKVARDDVNRPKVFNSGVVLYSQEGMRVLKRVLPSVLAYQVSMRLAGLPRFYRLDQNYLNTFIGKKGVDFRPLDGRWNAQITMVQTSDGTPCLIDERDERSQFFHLQHGPTKPDMTREEAASVAVGAFDFSQASEA